MFEEKLKKSLLENIRKLNDLKDKIEDRWAVLAEQDQPEFDNEPEPFPELEYESSKEEIAEQVYANEQFDKMQEEEIRRILEGDLDEIVHKPLSSDKELNELYDEYSRILSNTFDIMVEWKYYPLFIQRKEEIEMINKAGHFVDDWLGAISLLDIKPPQNNINKFLDERYLLHKEEMKVRLNRVSPLLLNFNVDSTTLFFYRQVIKCYIYEAFEAASVLCRAISETMLKEYLVKIGQGEELVAGNNSDNKKGLSQICLKDAKMDKKLIDIYGELAGKANYILHTKELVTDEDAIKNIKLLRKFIEIFPKPA